MLTVEQAQELVLRHARPFSAEFLQLSAASLGLVLAEDVASDIDMPPYDKALMDGYAVLADDLRETQTVLTVVEEILAGHMPKRSIAAGQAARIMTGAALPPGADTIVKIENTEPIDDGRVRFKEPAAKVGQNILPKGREMRCGETVLKAGVALRPQEIGLLATVGKTTIRAIRRPFVAVVSTGDEVIEPPTSPGPGQIRNSNASMLSAQVVRAGGVPRYLGIARDRFDSLRPLLDEGLEADVLILSGGVSAGKVDHVPAVLKELGVEPIFHKIQMKPGKPLFFGTKGQALVFGLPGNPVSALVGFELFVRPAIRRLMGLPDPKPCFITARMGCDFSYSTDRPTYHPAQLEWTETGWRVMPVPWFGSADLRAISGANAFVVLMPDRPDYKAGEAMRVLAPEL